MNPRLLIFMLIVLMISALPSVTWADDPQAPNPAVSNPDVDMSEYNYPEVQHPAADMPEVNHREAGFPSSSMDEVSHPEVE